MFDTVSRKDYGAMRDRAVAAEARERELREQNAALTRQLEAANDRYHALVSRLHPDPAELARRAPAFFGAPHPPQLTAEEIMRVPAVGGRGLAERQYRADEARLREGREAEAGQRQDRRAELSPDEERELEAALAGGK